jgi:hypothetical protein
MSGFCGRRWRVTAGCCTVLVGGCGRIFTGGKDLIVIPGDIIVFEGSIKRGEFAVDDELCDDILFPIFGGSVDSLGSEITKVDDRILVMCAVR